MNTPQLASVQPHGRGLLHEIMAEVAAKHSISIERIKSPSRVVPVASARNEFYYRAMCETGREVTVIAMACNRTSATVMSGSWRHAIKNGLAAARGISRAHWVKYQ